MKHRLLHGIRKIDQRTLITGRGRETFVQIAFPLLTPSSNFYVRLFSMSKLNLWPIWPWGFGSVGTRRPWVWKRLLRALKVKFARSARPQRLFSNFSTPCNEASKNIALHKHKRLVMTDPWPEVRFPNHWHMKLKIRSKNQIENILLFSLR